MKTFENSKSFIFASDAKDFYKSLKTKEKKIVHSIGIAFPVHFVFWN